MLVALLLVVEAGDVGAVGVDDTGVAVGHPLGDDLRHTGTFLDPDGGGGPEVLDIGKLTETRHGVGGEGEQTVDGVLDLGVAEHVHQLDGLFHLLVEVVGGEGHLGRTERGLFVRRDLVGVVQDRAVGVGADLHRAGRLALVAEGVHIADDRVADLVVGLGEHIERADVGHLVHGRDERDVGVGHVGDLVRPHTAGDHDVLGVDRALVGDDTGDLAPTVRTRRVVGEDVEHLGVGEDLAAGLLDGFLAHHGAGLEGVDHRDGRAVEAAEDDVFVDERHELLDLCGVEQVGLDAPRRGGGHPTLEFVHALLGSGDLDATGIDREVHVAVLVGGLLTEQRHFLVVVDREDEVRRMAGRAARVGQRALVQQDEVGPAETGQMAHQAVADDAGADDDDLGGSREVAHVGSPQCWCDAVSGVGDALGSRDAVA